MAGLRESNDIDLFVSPTAISTLIEKGWVKNTNKPGLPYTYNAFEAYTSWDFGQYWPALQHLLKTADYIDGVPFASIEEVKKWKVTCNRPKDIRDVKLIDQFLVNQNLPSTSLI